MKKICFLFLLFAATLTYSQTIKTVSAEDFKKEVSAGKGILIDLRTPEEVKNKGCIPNSTHIDFLSKEAESQIAKLDKSKTYLIYCAGGGRSGDCAEIMKSQGFKSVINLDKGFDDWKKKGFEVEKK